MSMARGPDWQAGEKGSAREELCLGGFFEWDVKLLLPAWHIHHRFLLSQAPASKSLQHREEDQRFGMIMRALSISQSKSCSHLCL